MSSAVDWSSAAADEGGAAGDRDGVALSRCLERAEFGCEGVVGLAGDVALLAIGSAILAGSALLALRARRRAAREPAHGLPVGAPAPDFVLPTLDGDPVGLDALRQPGANVLLVFTAADCAACVKLAAA